MRARVHELPELVRVLTDVSAFLRAVEGQGDLEGRRLSAGEADPRQRSAVGRLLRPPVHLCQRQLRGVERALDLPAVLGFDVGALQTHRISAPNPPMRSRSSSILRPRAPITSRSWTWRGPAERSWSSSGSVASPGGPPSAAWAAAASSVPVMVSAPADSAVASASPKRPAGTGTGAPISGSIGL